MVRTSPFKKRLRRVKWALVDAREQWARRWIVPHRGAEKHNLSPYQVYPWGRNLNVDFLTEPREHYPKLIEKGSTRVASIGSCFAVEVRRHLLEAGFHFVSTSDSWAGSAEWGRVYTTKNMLQIFQYTFDLFDPSIRFIRAGKRVLDPYRDQIAYVSEAEAEKGIARHYKESREALSSCDVLIITPGQNEAWIDAQGGYAWAHKPPPEAFAQYGDSRFKVKRFSLEENKEYLENILALLWKHRPKVKIIFTLSPVPSSATFDDVNVAMRSFENKAILLLAVKQTVERYYGKAFYFPSYEMALLSRNTNLRLDNRHVRSGVVEKIMASFEKRFVTS